ncbi:MAG: Gfo/Idh/MocA family oxidoreductase [Acidimicrobiia bacterium]|nr:Gfo/Idh/MocA family oxidoreductase [Acidimicrobiia bacterium]
MNENPVIDLLGRRLRLAVIGGGPGSFIGAMHRAAARLDDRYELVAGALSSDPDRSRQACFELGLDPSRSYGSGAELIEAEAARDDGADVVAVMTPNDSHHPLALATLDAGFDLIIDKPLTNTFAEAIDVLDAVRVTGLICCLTHNYTGYPMVRQARAMVADGMLGDIRLVQVEYVQGGKARPATFDADQALPWRYDPVRGGPSLVMGDIGTHAHNLLRFITGREVAELAAEVGTIMPGGTVHDYAGAMLRLDNGARGSFWVTQASAGVENCLRIRVSGAEGSLEWEQERPTALTFKPLDGPVQLRTPNGPDTSPLAARSSRIVAGHPEGFHEGFANLYTDAAETIAARRAGVDSDPLAVEFPDAEDGAMGVAFVEAAIASDAVGGAWTELASLP